jgi:hypothetical protein
MLLLTWGGIALLIVLHRDYTVHYFFWEMVELGRRTLLIGWVLLVPTEKTFLRLLSAPPPPWPIAVLWPVAHACAWASI